MNEKSKFTERNQKKILSYWWKSPFLNSDEVDNVEFKFNIEESMILIDRFLKKIITYKYILKVPKKNISKI